MINNCRSITITFEEAESMLSAFGIDTDEPYQASRDKMCSVVNMDSMDTFIDLKTMVGQMDDK